MEVVAREILPALAKTAPGVRFTAFVNREAADLDGGGAERIVVPVRARNRAEWVRGEQQLLPRLAANAGCDLVHSLGNTGPLWGHFARVTTVHDLHHRLVPEAHFGLNAVGLRVLVSAAVRRSQRIVAVSRSTSDDLVSELGTPRAKIDVVPNGLGTTARVAPTPEAALRSRLGLGDRPVVLSVSAKRPHKNLGRLIEAHARLEPRPVLVLPGYPTPYEAELRALAERLGVTSHVRFEGWLAAEDLEGLYALASAFVFPSLYEGFGLPVLEAMNRGVPVACSGRKSLAEVAGDAALLFDPDDPEAIALALRHLLGDRAMAERLRRAGRAQAARFTWERTAEGTLASYERALAES